jgi:CubicO group peptidase (beta-lactamase class C family)
MRAFVYQFAMILLTCAVADAQAPTQQTSSPMRLSRGTPESQGVSSADLLAFIDAANEIDAMHSFMLVRHGQVVAEGWWSPFDPETPHIFYSLSKSFTSTAVGLAIAEGKLSLDDEVLKFFPEEAPADPSPNLRSMRVRDLLRMSTGHQSEPSLWRDDPRTRGDTWTKKFLAHPVPFKPGTHFVYNSPATYMQSAIVQKVTGMTVLDYLRPRLFEPIGYDNPIWISSPEGVTVGAYGLSGRTEDIARFGQVYLQKGKWQDRQLIPAAWVAEATSMQTSNGSSPKSDWDQGYGYQFWRSRHQSFRGDGAFGQYCLVLPEKDAVIAITGGVRDMQRVMNLVWEKLLPALGDKPLAENPSSHTLLKQKLAGLAVTRPGGKAMTPTGERISGKWFELEENDRGLRAISLDFSDAGSPALLVRTADSETRTNLGMSAWARNSSGFVNGIDKFLGVPAKPVVAAGAAWTADDTLTIKLVPYETPYYSTLTVKLDADRMVIESEHNVAFGPTKQTPLKGKLAPAK